MSEDKKGLGRGLQHLGVTSILSSIDAPKQETPSLSLPVDCLQPGPFQPRKHFDPNALKELSDSIQEHGIIQPIVVRKNHQNNYDIIAGERRWQAAKMAGLPRVPVVIKTLNDDQCAAVGIIENIQREDLDVIEEANAIGQLIDRFNFTHQQTSKILGKSRSAISNLLRLLQLHPDVKTLIQEKKMDMGHARALLALPLDIQPEIAKKIIALRLSVRATESMVQRIQSNPSEKTPKAPLLESIEKEWSQKLNRKVKIQSTNKGNGKITLSYQSLAELQNLLNSINYRLESTEA